MAPGKRGITVKMRPYQHDALAAIKREWETVTSTLVVMPTGTGKTILFASLIRSCFPKRALVLAHREELIFQAADKIQKVTGFRCEVEMAGYRADLGKGLLSAVAAKPAQSDCTCLEVPSFSRFIVEFRNSFIGFS